MAMGFNVSVCRTCGWLLFDWWGAGGQEGRAGGGCEGGVVVVLWHIGRGTVD